MSILDLTYVNPPFDTTNPDWAAGIAHNGRFLSDADPVWEWTPVLDPANEFDDPVAGLSGTAIHPRLSRDGTTGDLPFTHPFGNDWQFDVALDESYRRLLATGNTNQPQPRQDPGTIESIAIANRLGLMVDGVMHVEIDRGLLPLAQRAQQGDRIAILGRWIVDTGHNDPYGAEIHPPLMMACARPITPYETFLSVGSRPFLVGQGFGDGALRQHLLNEIVQVELNPFKNRIEAHPQIHEPFHGIVLMHMTVRPPTSRTSPSDSLQFQFHFTTRTGVAVQVVPSADSVDVWIAMNDVGYSSPPVPSRHDRFVSVDDLAKAEHEVSQLVSALIAASVVFNPLKPWVPLVIQADELTDLYDPLQALSIHDSNIRDSAVVGQDFLVDDSQPFPIYGWMSVWWQGKRDLQWANWQEVAGNGSTDVSPAAVNYGGKLFLFARGINDAQIYQNAMGQDADHDWNWTGWSEVPGAGTTGHALVSAIGPDDKLYLFATGINDPRVYLNVMNSSEAWTGWTEVPGQGTTDARLSAVLYGTRLYLFAKGINDRRIYGNVLDTTGTWTGWREIPGGGTTDTAAASEVGADNRLYLFAKGIDDRRIYVNVMDITGAWTGWREVPGGGTTDAALQATRHGSSIYLFARGINDQQIYLNVMDATGAWTGWQPIAGQATTQLGLGCASAPNGSLLIFHTGNDQRIYYMSNVVT